jgi:hypothetical protein
MIVTKKLALLSLIRAFIRNPSALVEDAMLGRVEFNALPKTPFWAVIENAFSWKRAGRTARYRS